MNETSSSISTTFRHHFYCFSSVRVASYVETTMLSTSMPQFHLLSFAFVPNVFAQSNYDGASRSKRRTGFALETLQGWYNTSTGLWESTGWWNGANIMTMIGDFAKAAPGDEILQNLASDIFATTLLKAPAKNPQMGIEDPPSNNTTPFSINATGYKKFLDSYTDELYITYPLDWYDNNNGRFMHTGVSFGHDDNRPSYLANPDSHDWLDGYYDDDLWWALAWINAYDVTFNPTYLDLAEDIFIAVSHTWGTYCSNGGIYWSWEKKYVNAIANELFLSTAAHLANRVQRGKKRAVYRYWAEKSLDWFMDSGMINNNGTINDGLTEDCENNNKTTWSYNQGVILGGLVELHRAATTPNPLHLTLAYTLAQAALIALSDGNGVIHDECEPDCGGDGAQFKGIFMRNLVKLNSVVQDDMFANAIRKNAASIWEWDTKLTSDGLPVFSVNWAGPWISPANASMQSSAMDALVAAVVVDLTS
jgi:predicted alpha-1,6-mannanase (GH76 family)